MRHKRKTKKYTLTLGEVELRRLSQYAAESSLTRPVALRRIVSQTLREYTPKACPTLDERQLGLFDSLQFDIFNQTSKTNEAKE